MADTISPAAARRIALAAQGFGRPHPEAVGTRQLNLLLARLGVLQIDSVNVFERSHYLPVFARLGAYDKRLLDALTFSPTRRLHRVPGARGRVHPDVRSGRSGSSGATRGASSSPAASG